MSDTHEGYHRVISRRTAVALLVALCGLVGLLAWLGLVWSEAYVEHMTELVQLAPEQGRRQLARDLKLIAVLHGVPLWAAVGLLIWYGYRGMRTASMPPLGSWVLQDQRVLTGPRAVVAARILLFFAGLLALLVIATTGLIWRMAAQAQV